MTNKKSTKRSLLFSALSLFLCIGMLAGTTFAWFTDSVSSKNNVIVSGNLDVELYWSIDGEKWDKVDEQDEIFKDETLWEPGHTEVVYLKVVNEGSLALKYQLGVNIVDEKTGTNMAGDSFKLSDYIEFGVKETAKAISFEKREDALTAIEEYQIISAGYTNSSKLGAKNNAQNLASEEYATLVVTMPETVGNVANHKKSDDPLNPAQYAPSIQLGITLFATQLAAEEDSFDANYDKDAWHPDFVVTSAAELKTAIQNVEDGGLILLVDDLVFDKDSRTHNSGSYYDGLYYIGDKSFTIDLDGHTITNDGSVNDYLLNFKNDGAKANTITIKNGTVDAASSAYCAIATSSSNAQKITIDLENVNLIGNNSGGAVAKIRGGAELNVKSGTTITGKNSYSGIEAAGKTTVVNIFEGAKIYQNGTGSSWGSLLGVSGGATANVYGGSGVSAKGCFMAMTSGGTINISGGEWIANTNGAYANSNNSVLIAQSESHWKSIINVTGGTFKGGYNCYGAAAGDAQINISGGNFNADPAKYVAADYQSVDNGNGTWSVIFPQDSFNDLINNAKPGDTVEVPAGEYTFPASNLKAGQTLNCAPGTVFEGKSAMNINGATVIGATFSNPDGVAGAGTINGTFKDCVFEGSEALRWCYAGETVVFENCEFKTDFRGVHFDGMDHDVIFRNCKLNGFNAFGGTATVTFEGCTFGHDESRYNGLNMYCDTVLKDCKFEFVSGKTNFIDFEEAGHNLTITNCTATLDGEAANVLDFVGGTYENQTNITIDGKTVTSNAADVVNGGNFLLTGDIQNNSAIKNDTSIDLGGNTFEATGTVNLTGNADLTMTNGDYVVNGTFGHIDVRPDSAEGSTLLFENVDFSYNKLEKTYGPSTNRLGTVVEICAAAADAKSVVVFRNCTFNNAQVLIEGLSGKIGIVDVTFENCTFNALTSSAPIKVDNYVNGKVTVTGCTFNLECTSSVASAISVNPSSSTVIELIASNNTINATAATASGENGTVEQVKVNGTPANIKFISAYDNATVTETNTVKSGIAKQ